MTIQDTRIFNNTETKRAPFFPQRIAQSLFNWRVQRMISHGTLEVIFPGGAVSRFGDGAQPVIRIEILRPSVLWGLVFYPEMTLGEAYTDGDLVVRRGDVFGFIDLLISNLGPGPAGRLGAITGALQHAARWLAQHNPELRARRNVAHHYDLSDALYETFLDKNRQYSCAYFTDETQSLEQAQLDKLDRIAAKLCLKPGMRVLDIGSGWGGLALHLARNSGVRVDGITLSDEQLVYARKISAQNGLPDRVSFALRDYRDVSETYDRVVSVGMFEHVGAPHYDEYFRTIAASLNKDGVGLVHTIGRSGVPGTCNPWIAKYIFPGGYCPALSEIIPAIERAGLVITDIEVLRLHYAHTLAQWRARFIANRGKVSEMLDERFCRMWEFYLALSETVFRHGGHVVFQIQLAKQPDAVPVTRGYIEGTASGGRR